MTYSAYHILLNPMSYMNCKMKTFFSRFKIQKTVSNGRMFCLETPKFSTLSLLHQLLFKEKTKPKTPQTNLFRSENCKDQNMPFSLLYSKKHRCDQYEDIFDLLFLIKDFPVFASSGENKTVEEPFSLCHTTQNGSRSRFFTKSILGCLEYQRQI